MFISRTKPAFSPLVLTLLLIPATFHSVLAQGRGAPEPAKRPWMDPKLSPDQRADLVLEQLTLDEKIALVHGVTAGRGVAPQPALAAVLARSNGGAGMLPGVPRLGVPDLNLADAAVGVTRAAARSRYSTPLPSGVSLSSTWDPKAAYEYGALIGRELRDQGYNSSLGGGVNLMREPRNGRNFEYLGEDPVLAGKLVAQVIKGTQDQGIVGDVKHYALNDQEIGRHVASVNVGKRVMRETDLLPFEIAIKEAQPAMVMCSYNRINGDYACENKYLLNDLLKGTWNFKGVVISDWGATHTAAKAAMAGLDLEMPDGTWFGDPLKKAVENGEVPMERLNDMVHRILRSAFAAGVVDRPPVPKVVDVFGGLETAQKVAEQGTVLLKNADGQLPLNAASIPSIALIGSHADVGVLSGGGSAQVDPPGGNAVPSQPRVLGTAAEQGFQRPVIWHPSSPLKAIRAKAPRAKVEYNDGTDVGAAAALAKASSVAIVFVNQPLTEGNDALSLTLPDNQDELVSAVVAANPRTIVVLETGGPVSMPWIDHVKGVLAAWYPGIRGAEAIANILFGDVNPSGKLTATFARSDADLPHSKIIGSDLKPEPPAAGSNRRPQLPPFDVIYTEGLKVGYKWFEAEGKTPLFPFGFGLSYTPFEYSGLKATAESVTFTVKNTGKRAGAEIAQVYAALPPSTNEPPKRLVAWARVQLEPGESKSITLSLEPLFLSIFNEARDSWELVPGNYKLLVGGSSQNTPITAAVSIGAPR
jgi:beta-glucosidase